MNKKIDLLAEEVSKKNKYFSHYRDQLHSNTLALTLAFNNIQNITLAQNSIINNIKLNEILAISNTILMILESNINDIMFIKSKVENTIEAAVDHKTSPTLFTFPLLQSLLQESLTKLRADTIVPLSKENFHEILHNTWSINTITPYTLIIIFPFTNMEIFRTIHVIPFPLLINDSLATNSRIKLIPNADIYFINKQTLKYSYSSKENYKNCIHQHNVALCPMISPIIPFANPDCIVSLYTNHSLMTTVEKVKCKFETYSSSIPYSLLINRSLIISFHKSVGSLLTCKTPFHNEEIMTGSIVILQPSCNLRANEFQFSNPLHIQNHSTIHADLLFPHKTDSILQTDYHIQNTFPTYVQGSIHNPVTWDKYLDHINGTLALHNTHFKFIPLYTITTTGCVFFISILLFCFGCYFKNRKYKNYSNPTQNVPLQHITNFQTNPLPTVPSSSPVPHIYDTPKI